MSIGRKELCDLACSQSNRETHELTRGRRHFVRTPPTGWKAKPEYAKPTPQAYFRGQAGYSKVRGLFTRARCFPCLDARAAFLPCTCSQTSSNKHVHGPRSKGNIFGGSPLTFFLRALPRVLPPGCSQLPVQAPPHGRRRRLEGVRARGRVDHRAPLPQR